MLLLALAGLLVLGKAALDAATLLELYGDGPPYYGRTANMDKWGSPFPWMIYSDLVVLGVVIALIVLARRTGAHHPST